MVLVVQALNNSMKSKQCKIEGCNNPVWGNGLCVNHKPRKPLPQKKVLKNSQQDSKIEDWKLEMIKYIDERNAFFNSIWKKRPHKSEISGDPLGKEPLTTFFHHILPKEKYPEGEFDEENIILLTLDEHTNVENDMYRYKEINKRREYLKAKYERIKQGEETRD